MNYETVVVKINRNSTNIDVYIGRPSKWGNPFRIGRDGDRDEVIAKYEAYVRNSQYLLNSLHELRGKVLGCYCKPLACHGDVLVKLVKEYFGDQKDVPRDTTCRP